MIIAECAKGCLDPAMTGLSYQYTIFQEWNIKPNDPQKKWIECILSTSGNKINIFIFVFDYL